MAEGAIALKMNLRRSDAWLATIRTDPSAADRQLKANVAFHLISTSDLISAPPREVHDTG
jgi:hypothetical protein